MKSIPDFLKRKAVGEPIVMLTCYDAATARVLEKTSVDALLVGDSCAMVVHGFESTVHATAEMMLLHVAATRRGAPSKLIVADLPFLSHRRGLEAAVEASGALMRAGANAVKLEGARGNLEIVRHLVDSGIPVMGHLGLTPQSVNAFGGYRMQARDEDAARQLVVDARELERSGCFAVVLECVPGRVAEEATAELTIPTIGIGCGPSTSGQVLVINDILGTSGFQPRFARRYANLDEAVAEAAEAYVADARARRFPGEGEYAK